MAFAQYTVRLLQDAELSRRLGESAAARIRDHHGLETMVSAYQTVYRGVVASPSSD